MAAATCSSVNWTFSWWLTTVTCTQPWGSIYWVLASSYLTERLIVQFSVWQLHVRPRWSMWCARFLQFKVYAHSSWYFDLNFWSFRWSFFFHPSFRKVSWLQRSHKETVQNNPKMNLSSASIDARSCEFTASLYVNGSRTFHRSSVQLRSKFDDTGITHHLVGITQAVEKHWQCKDNTRAFSARIWRLHSVWTTTFSKEMPHISHGNTQVVGQTGEETRSSLSGILWN